MEDKKEYYVYDIEWDTEGEDIDIEDVGLPKKVDIPDNVLKDVIEYGTDVLENWLADEYDFLVYDYRKSDDLEVFCKELESVERDTISFSMIDQSAIEFSCSEDNHIASFYVDTTMEADDVLFNRICMANEDKPRKELIKDGVPESSTTSFSAFKAFVQKDVNDEPYINTTFDVDFENKTISVLAGLAGTSMYGFEDATFKLTSPEVEAILPCFAKVLEKELGTEKAKFIMGETGRPQKKQESIEK